MNAMEKFAPLLGRILIALLFIPAGIGKLKGFEGTVQYIAAQGLPLPQVGAVVAIVVEVLVALALLVGFKGRIAALILALFTLAAAFCFHQFWAAAPEQATMQSINFFKNMAIAGGLLFAATFGPGPFSIDARKR